MSVGSKIISFFAGAAVALSLMTAYDRTRNNEIVAGFVIIQCGVPWGGAIVHRDGKVDKQMFTDREQILAFALKVKDLPVDHGAVASLARYCPLPPGEQGT